MLLGFYFVTFVVANLLVGGGAIKITNGPKAGINEHPYSVWIQYNGSLACGGSLIDKEWVLTLAQCMSDRDLSKYIVVVGDRLTGKEDGEVEVIPAKVVEHPTYNETTGADNLALVLLSEPVDTSLDNIGVVPLTNMSLDGIIAKEKTCALSAFGARSLGRPSAFKETLDVNIKLDSVCSKRDGYDPDLNICFRAEDSDSTACTGDEGSPVLCKIQGNWTQVGINIQGDCQKKRMIGIQVSAYLDWIRESMAEEPEPVPKAKITLDDLFRGKYSPRSFYPTWVPGEDAFYYRSGVSLYKYNCDNGTADRIISDILFPGVYVYEYRISTDQNYALVGYDARYDARYYRIIQKYKILKFSTGQIEDLEGPSGAELQYVGWSTSEESALVFVQDNDIYYRRRPFRKTFRVTYTGVEHVIFNGIGDWSVGGWNPIFWSPDGHYFIYNTFDLTSVGKYDLTNYGPPEMQYVENRPYPYQKAGTTNPVASTSIYDTRTGLTVKLAPPEGYNNTGFYITSMVWQDEVNVMINWVNRPQNYSVYTLCNAANGNCETNYEVSSGPAWLITRYVPPIFSSSGDIYFLLLPHGKGEAGEFMHIAMIDARKSTGNYKRKTTFVTTGDYDVSYILSYDDANRMIYFLAYEEGDSTTLRLYRTTTRKSLSEFRKPVCMSCFRPGKCEWVSASFSYSSAFYFLNCLGPDVPTYTLYSIANGKERVFENNQDLRKELANADLPKTEYVRIPIDGNRTMPGRMVIPSSYTGMNDTQYDLVNYVYGGPLFQVVTKEFFISYDEVLASSHNMVVGRADGRGSIGQGVNWAYEMNRRLGTVEVDDALTAGRYFKSMPFVSDNAAIWGGSYGGFNTLMALGRGTDVFKCGISMVPVTDWKYYYTGYTEAYMGRPEENEEGYEFARVARYARNFKKSYLFLVDSTGDDNVHFQNTAQFTKALVAANVQFRMMVYADNTHSINAERNSQRHFYDSMTNYMKECFEWPAPTEEPEEEVEVKQRDGPQRKYNSFIDEMGIHGYGDHQRVPWF